MEVASFKAAPQPIQMRRHPPSGFCGISRRVGKKPVIAAVNGLALGGGTEIVLNWYVSFSYDRSGRRRKTTRYEDEWLAL